MKKLFFLAAVATMTLASCMNDEFIGAENSPTVANTETDAINFGFKMQNATRADFIGSGAATKLGNRFVVYGTKHVSAEDKNATNDAVVFNNFQVNWQTGTAGNTASNTSDWEYVGKQAYGATPTSQGIKYWDYAANNGYTFYAFSSSNITCPANSSDLVSVTKVTEDGSSLYNKGYKLTVKNGASLNNLYFSDRLPVAKTNYGETVNLTFRNIGAKVRVGFYETIPGYTVQIKKFYIDEAASAAVTDFTKMKFPYTDGFRASLQNVKRNVDQTLDVTYYESGETQNRPKVTNPTAGFNYDLKLGSDLLNVDLSDNAAAPTWDTSDATDNHYTPVFPFEGNTNPLLLKLDFTMTATDGSGDVINVRGARAIVPAEYVKWKSNFAYTYIFKISDKSNGTTGAVDSNGDPEDPEGLKPITFDAIVINVDDEVQQTITSVSTNSITTYAEGAIVNEYNKTQPIYVVISDKTSHDVINPTGIGDNDGYAQVYSMSKAATEAEVLGQLTGSPMGITMSAVSPAATKETTIPLADGTTPSIVNVKFTPSAAGYYAYVYTTTKYAAPTYAVQTSGTYNSSNVYYMRSTSGAYYVVTVPNETAFNANKASLYLQTDPGTPGVYDVKVIKVQ